MPIQITAKRDAFRRCGMAHSDKTQTYADGHFSQAELAELQAEPMLVVTLVTEGQATTLEQGEALTAALAKNAALTERNEALLAEVQRRADNEDALLAQVEALTLQLATPPPATATETTDPVSGKQEKTTK